jgi:hypothetical protein
VLDGVREEGGREGEEGKGRKVQGKRRVPDRDSETIYAELLES